MIRLLTHTRRLVGELPYRDRLPGGTVGTRRVPIIAYDADGLPHDVEALMLTSDLQGSAGLSSAPVLPLEALVDTLRLCAQNGTIPALERTVALLAGDFWAQPDSSRRGGQGDVRNGIRRVRDAFLSTVVVFGNHDRVGDSPSDLIAFGRERGIHLASDRLVDVHGVTIAGVDGVVGDPERRPFRRPLAEFVAAVERAVQQRPNIVLLHQGPSRGTERRPTVPAIDAACQQCLGGLVVFGHDHEVYGDPTHPAAREFGVLDVRDGLQYVNTSERVILAINSTTGG